ncbi:MAG: hypothetical protein AMJ81_09015 [Phycisphaerae bacterium SM23_33]|nr:MAG: hypothetical protein AMJ81_09015 [Phycisphaerae bacterium SM23_33]
MTKRELIDEIARLNPTASADFLAEFPASDLTAYLERLKWAHPPEEAAVDVFDELEPAEAQPGPIRLVS